MSTRDSSQAPSSATPERERTPAPRSAGASDVRLLGAGIEVLAAQVETLRQRSGGRPPEFFTQWAAWKAEWDVFAAQKTAVPTTPSPADGEEPPMSAEDRARLRRYVEQYESIRQGVLRALELPGQTQPAQTQPAQTQPGQTSDAGSSGANADTGWPWWAWAVLLGGGAAVALHAAGGRNE